MPRISERHRYWVANNRVSNARSGNVDALQKLSTQKRINSLKDDPLGLSSSLKLRQNLSEIDQMAKNVDFTKGFLDVTESATGAIFDTLSRAKELAIAMANDNYDAQSREATSKEVSELISQVIQMGNSKFSGKYVFSGFRSLAPAMDQEGNFLGDDGEIYLPIGSDQYKKINIPGRDLFEVNIDERGEGHFNMLDSLNLLRAGMEKNDKDAIYKSLDELDYQMNKVLSFRASVGASWNAVDNAKTYLTGSEQQKVENLSRIEDADMYQATSDFKRTETILQSTLMATNKLLQPSLLNFMS